MKTLMIPILTILLAFFYQQNQSDSRTENAAKEIEIADTLKFDQEKSLEALRKEIEGKKDQPAGEVFENIEMFKQVNAGRLLNIMEKGFSRSLGVTCTHCHNPDDWSSDEKEEKIIAREMMKMAGKINRELLPSIKELGDRNALVNCTTCHRGDVKPALNLGDN